MKTDFRDVMTISTAVEMRDNDLMINTRFMLDKEFQYMSFEFQHIMLTEILSSFKDMLDQVKDKMIWEQNYEAAETKDELVQSAHDLLDLLDKDEELWGPDDETIEEKIEGQKRAEEQAAKRRRKMH